MYLDIVCLKAGFLKFSMISKAPVTAMFTLSLHSIQRSCHVQNK